MIRAQRLRAALSSAQHKIKYLKTSREGSSGWQEFFRKLKGGAQYEQSIWPVEEPCCSETTYIAMSRSTGMLKACPKKCLLSL